MTDFDPESWSLGVHGTLAVLSLGGYYKCGDRTEAYSKIAGELEQLLDSLRVRICGQLERELEPVFERAPGNPRFSRQREFGPQLLLPNGYSEQAASPVGSDAYREAIRSFLASGGGDLLDSHWGLRRAVHRWCDAAKALSWVLLGGLAWELICCGALGLLSKLIGVGLPSWFNGWSFLPTALCAFAFIAALASALWNHDIIMNHRRQYRDL